jgi:putative SOS response-associated peptidase YedK
VSRTDEEPLALAGIWSVWTDKEKDQDMQTFSILTTEADGFMERLHHRMPVTIAEADWAGWLDPQVGETEAVKLAMHRPAKGEWQAWPVSTKVNSVKNDGPELVEPVERS